MTHPLRAKEQAGVHHQSIDVAQLSALAIAVRPQDVACITGMPTPLTSSQRLYPRSGDPPPREGADPDCLVKEKLSIVLNFFPSCSSFYSPVRHLFSVLQPFFSREPRPDTWVQSTGLLRCQRGRGGTRPNPAKTTTMPTAKRPTAQKHHPFLRVKAFLSLSVTRFMEREGVTHLLLD